MQLSEIFKYEYANICTLVGIKMQGFIFPALLPSNSCSLKMTISLLKPIKMQKNCTTGEKSYAVFTYAARQQFGCLRQLSYGTI